MGLCAISFTTGWFRGQRKEEEEFSVNLRLELNYMPEKYELSPALTEVLGIDVETHARIIFLFGIILWFERCRTLMILLTSTVILHFRKYLEKEWLSSTESQKTSHLICLLDTPYIWNTELNFLEIALLELLSGTACYDVMVDVSFPIQREVNALTEKTKEIEACDEAIVSDIRKIHEHRRRRAFFLGFSQSPVEFIYALLESQIKNLKFVGGEASRNAEKERRSCSQPWVEDAVIGYLNRKPTSDAPGSG